ncbi:MAG: phosphoenolpyruvate--protein phosphotransferase [Pseudomonadota bacterium]|nr:phosphoenolpyruvate--protein phosphotransferase [Pseudomonadota bacterium]
MKSKSPIILKGLPVSKGIAIGRSYVIEHGKNIVKEKYIKKNQIHDELIKLDGAIESTISNLKKIKDKINPSVKNNIGLLFDTHIMLVNDTGFIGNIKNRIKKNLNSPDWAIYSEYLSIKESFDDIDDTYIKQRIDDVSHVVNMILKSFKIKKTTKSNKKENLEDLIIVTDDLSPADVVIASDSNSLGIISTFGGRSSHSSILTRSLELPSIVGVKSVLNIIKNDDELIMDGEQGVVIINPDSKIKDYYTDLQKNQAEKKKMLSSIVNRNNLTLDKTKIDIMANLELPQELKIINDKKVDGVGLFRTEYLYVDRNDFPSEQEQYDAYKKIVKKMGNSPIYFRTLDIGADKEVPENIKTGSIARNPALGLRGIRYSLNYNSIFINQIKAILRASHTGNIKIMLPMITTLSEIYKAKELIKIAKETLVKEKKKFDKKIQVGIMVEVPSCAVLADRFAKHVDFFSIGTNDLVQYTLAIDRVDDEVNYLYNPVNSAVLYLIKTIISAGIKNKIPVSLCGEMAGDPNYTRLLLGLGLKSFSMHPSAIPEVKNIIINSDLTKLDKLSKKIVSCDSSIEKNKLIKKLNSI